VKTWLAAPRGFSLTEVLVTLALVGLMVGPLSVGISSVVTSVSIREELTALSNAARGKMEEVLAMGFTNIPLSSPPGTPNVLSDQVTIRGNVVDRRVIVDLADGSLPPDGLADPDFKQITIEVGSVQLHSRIARGL
jgi:prepilin-type N-terminal cleavage/methylation domain-containing protein